MLNTARLGSGRGYRYGTEVGAPVDDDVLTALWDHEDGLQSHTVQCCIDSAGHRTEAVYPYVKPRQVRGVYATVGRAGVGRPIISSASNRKQGQTTLPVKLFTVGVDEAKTILYSRLKEQTPGLGYRHLSEAEGYEEKYLGTRLPFPNQAIVEVAPNGHPFGLMGQEHSEPLKRAKTGDRNIQGWRR